MICRDTVPAAWSQGLDGRVLGSLGAERGGGGGGGSRERGHREEQQQQRTSMLPPDFACIAIFRSARAETFTLHAACRSDELGRWGPGGCYSGFRVEEEALPVELVVQMVVQVREEMKAAVHALLEVVGVIGPRLLLQYLAVQVFVEIEESVRRAQLLHVVLQLPALPRRAGLCRSGGHFRRAWGFFGKGRLLSPGHETQIKLEERRRYVVNEQQRLPDVM